MSFFFFYLRRTTTAIWVSPSFELLSPLLNDACCKFIDYVGANRLLILISEEHNTSSSRRFPWHLCRGIQREWPTRSLDLLKMTPQQATPQQTCAVFPQTFASPPSHVDVRSEDRKGTPSAQNQCEESWKGMGRKLLLLILLVTRSLEISKFERRYSLNQNGEWREI